MHVSLPLQVYFGVLDMVQCGCVDGSNVACSAGWQPAVCDWDEPGSWNDIGGLMRMSQVLSNRICASVSITLPI